MATALIQKIKIDKGTFLCGNLGGEQKRGEDQVTRFLSVTYAR